MKKGKGVHNMLKVFGQVGWGTGNEGGAPPLYWTALKDLSRIHCLINV